MGSCSARRSLPWIRATDIQLIPYTEPSISASALLSVSRYHPPRMNQRTWLRYDERHSHTGTRILKSIAQRQRLSASLYWARGRTRTGEGCSDRISKANVRCCAGLIMSQRKARGDGASIPCRIPAGKCKEGEAVRGEFTVAVIMNAERPPKRVAVSRHLSPPG